MSAQACPLRPSGSRRGVAAVDMHFDVDPERIFAVLSYPPHYGFWVPGSRGVHEYDADWPAVGATFRHSQGRWPLVISDTTSVLVCDPPRRLELEARVRPLLVSRVVLTLTAEPGGTRVRMEEHATGGLLGVPAQLPPSPQVLQARNTEALRRLRWIAEVGAVRSSSQPLSGAPPH
jgi:uncharacterized protein YndB with AHSA1/START domain